MPIEKFRNKILVGHVLDQLAKLPDDSVDMCITSPPYWGLRDYETEHQIWDEHLYCDHENEDSMCCDEHTWEQDGAQSTKLGHGGITHEINEKVQRPKSSPTFHCSNDSCDAWLGSLGLEPTPTLYISHLVQIFLEVKRVLKPTGTLWINLGDTYAGSASKNTKGRAGFDGRSEVVIRVGAEQKSLIGIPDRLKIALIDEGFLCRNEIIWYKPNAMPSSATDRFTNDCEKLYLFSMKKKYYFEQQFESFTEESLDDLLRRKTMTYYKEDGSESKYVIGETGLDGDKTGRTRDEFYGDLSKGRNKRTTWKEKKHKTGQYADGHSGYYNADGSIRGDPEKGRNKRTTWKYEDTDEEAMYRQGMHKSRGKGTVTKRNLPDKEEFVTWLKKNFTVDEIVFDTGLKRSTVEHWFRKDESGHSFPSVDDWKAMIATYYVEPDYNQLIETWEETDDITSSDKGRIKRTTWIDDDVKNVMPAVLWEVQTRAMPEAHFAVFPEALVEPTIKAGCPIEVCTECGKPKIIEWDTDKIDTRPGKNVLQGKSGTEDNPNLSLHSSDLSTKRQQIVRSNFKYVTQCKHKQFKPGIVMDIFMGSGTTATVAKRMGRDYIGIELNSEYAKIIDKRVRSGGSKANVPEGKAVTDVLRGL